MSFMFNPHPYDDPNAINRLPALADLDAVTGSPNVAARLVSEFTERLSQLDRSLVVAFDGYIGAQFDDIVNPVIQAFAARGVSVTVHDTRSLYKSSADLEAQFSEYLPEDREIDPVLLFGKLYHGAIEELFETAALETLKGQLNEQKSAAPSLVIVFGWGSACGALREIYDEIVYLDVTPKQAILRAKAGLVPNLGDTHPRPFKELLRRCYYVDFEVTGALRKELLHGSELGFYIARDTPGVPTLLSRTSLDQIFATLARQPFRCRPVYIEGVWGGTFIQKVRNLPAHMTKVAWIFDLIPLEVSIAVRTEAGLEIEFPYFTFVQKEGNALMGAETVERFGGYFPIRCNYDDTWHSSGHMSVQVHPTAEYCQSQNGERGGQDESYYVVATGHGAKTYLGYKEGRTQEEFLEAARRSESEKAPFEFEDFVHAVPSVPGTQLMLPGGTIHSSGQNQVVLEIGSLTVGSYTYKLYDYLRKDLDGNPRPIHLTHGLNVLDADRVAPQVERDLVPEPRLLHDDPSGWSEWLVGENKDIYFGLRRIDLAPGAEAQGDTKGIFHVLTLVDGENVIIQSVDDPSRCYHQSYLDMVVVPANVGRYIIRNAGRQSAVVHKTHLKEGLPTS